jgi:hypothetical protein
MEGIAQGLSEGGVSSHIDEADEIVESNGRTQDASITIYVFPTKREPRHPVADYPAVKLYSKKVSGTIRFHESTMAPGTGCQAAGISELPLNKGLVKRLTARLLELAPEARSRSAEQDGA